jgi:hypothetical protein
MLINKSSKFTVLKKETKEGKRKNGDEYKQYVLSLLDTETPKPTIHELSFYDETIIKSISEGHTVFLDGYMKQINVKNGNFDMVAYKPVVTNIKVVSK